MSISRQSVSMLVMNNYHCVDIMPVSTAVVVTIRLPASRIAWFWHVTRHDNLSKTILQGTLEGERRRGRAEEMLDGQHQRVDSPAHA